MPKYKVGDVAALFSVPKEPTSEAGKKLQSLFKEFHNKNKTHDQSYQNTTKKKENVEKGREENQSMFKKNKKRKFSAVSSPESNIEDSNVKKFKETSEYVDATFAKKNGKKKNNLLAVQNFPRKKKFKTDAGNFNNNSFNEFEAQENFSDIEQGSDATFKTKSRSKDKKHVSGFIKKSKQQKLAMSNGTIKNHDSKILFSEAFESDASFKDEIKNFIKHTTKKLKNKNSIDNFVSSSQFDTAASDKSESQNKECEKASNKQTYENSNTSLKGEIKAFKKKSPKKLKKKKGNNDNFMSSSQFNTVANDRSESQSNEKCEKTFNKQAFNKSDTSFRNEVKDFVRSAKKLKEKNISDNFIENSQPKVSEEGLDFVKIPGIKSEDEEDRLNRTLFVGNLPVNITKKDIKTLFLPFGEVQNIRYFGVETNKAKIFNEDGTKSLNPNTYAADSVPGFVVFKERQSAIYALSLSGSLFKGHHITVDFAMPIGSKKLYDDKRSIFIGNLPFGCTDESIWEFFSDCGRIESVRIVRDKETGIGKGFGYVQFSTVEAKEKALALEDSVIQGRSIRIKAIESNKAAQKKTNNAPPVRRDTFKSQAIKLKKKSQESGSRKSIKKIMKKQKHLHQKKKIANIMQKSMKS